MAGRPGHVLTLSPVNADVWGTYTAAAQREEHGAVEGRAVDVGGIGGWEERGGCVCVWPPMTPLKLQTLVGAGWCKM